MLLRPSTTCDEATRYLAVLTDQGLTAVQNAVPHLLHGGEEDASVRSEKIQTLRHTVYQYDQWTLTATTELSEVFADRSIPARMRGERYSNIVYGDFTARRQAQLLNLELQELRTYFLELAASAPGGAQTPPRPDCRPGHQ